MGEGLKRAAAAAKETQPRNAGCFGKLPAKEDPRTLRMSALLAPDLPPLPETFDLLPRVQTATNVRSVARLFPLDHNDRHGDCVVCAVAHAETLWDGMCGKKRVPNPDDVLAAYFHLTGGADSGLVELTTLNTWRKRGLLGERILAYAAVNYRDPEMVKRAISLFGGVMIGFNVQQDCIGDFRHHRTWTPGPSTGGGHAVWLYAYSPEGVSCLTWGATQRASWDWLYRQCDEMYAVFPGQATLATFDPGLDYAALQAGLAAVTS